MTGAVGAGLGVVAAASAGPNDKDTRTEDLTDEDVTGKMQLVRRGYSVDAGEGAPPTPRIGDSRCPECKRRSGLYCWHC